MAPGGRSWATPPGRMNAWFMRRPVIISKMARMRSRSRKPTVITVVAPISMPPVARATRWEVIRLSSMSRTRMTLARSGIWSVMPSSFSTREAERRLVEERREVVHAGAERHALGPGAELHVLLDAGVQVADARAGLGHRLAVELEDQAEHAVGRRVLRTHVDDDALLVEGSRLVDELVPVAAGGVEDVGALGGSGVGAGRGVDVGVGRSLGEGVDGAHQM